MTVSSWMKHSSVKKSDIEFFTHLVDDLGDSGDSVSGSGRFSEHLFEGSMWLLAWADQDRRIKGLSAGAEAVHGATPASTATER